MSTSGIYFADQNNQLMYSTLPVLDGLNQIENLFFKLQFYHISSFKKASINSMSLTDREIDRKTRTQTVTDSHNWIEGTAIPNVIELTSDEEQSAIQEIPSQKVIDSAVKANHLLQETVSKAPIHIEENWAQRTLVVNFFEVTSDISSAARSIDSLANIMIAQGDSHFLQLAGITSCFSIISGYVSGCRSYEKMQQAQKINDFWGTFIDGIKTTCGATRVLTGFVFIPLRGLSFAAAYTAVKSAAVAMAIGIVGAIGTALGILVSILIATPSVITIYKTI